MWSMTSLIYFSVEIPLFVKRKVSMFPKTPSCSSNNNSLSIPSAQTPTERSNFPHLTVEKFWKVVLIIYPFEIWVRMGTGTKFFRNAECTNTKDSIKIPCIDQRNHLPCQNLTFYQYAWSVPHIRFDEECGELGLEHTVLIATQCV